MLKEQIIQRDQHCVISRDYLSVKASHIVAHSWWMDHPDRKERLPEDIKTIIGRLDGNINHIAHGILLDGSLSDAFDRGDFSFQFVDGHYYVVSIIPRYDEIDGRQVDECLHNRCDGTPWRCPENRPNPYLMAFHLRNSVVVVLLVMMNLTPKMTMRMSTLRDRLSASSLRILESEVR